MINGIYKFSKVLDFLGLGEIILISFYYGVYWGILLGCKVLVFFFSSKFYILKYFVVNFVIDSW